MNVNENSPEDLIAKLSRDDFAAQINTKFKFYQATKPFEAELIEVSPLKTSPNAEHFSLLFKMPKDFALLQDIYPFEHEKIGSTEIFIVPIESNSENNIFEAVFNRQIKRN